MNPVNWQETYTNISPKLLGICRRYIKDIATAEDIVQDSFIVAIQKENTLKDVSALNGWLSRIVINMAIHHLKETKKIIFSTSENFEVIDTSTTMNTLELDNKSMLLASDLDRNDVLEAIDRLPEHHKSVFNMYVIDQFSHNDIAKTLEISVGTSKSHLSRARKSIQTFLFDKIKGQPVDKEKKRRIAFMLFLGFGNSMFASFYKKSFQDFEIKTTKPFSITQKNTSFPKDFIGLTKGISFSKILFSGIGFFSLVAMVFYFNNSKKTDVAPAQKQVITTIASEKKPAVNENITVAKDTLSNVVSTSKTESKIKKVSKEKEITTQSVAATVAENPVVELKKDSVKNELKKVVVIKRQIIKKDTVYVSK